MPLEHTNEITDKLSSLVYSQEVGNYSLQMAMFNIDGITNELCSSVYSWKVGNHSLHMELFITNGITDRPKSLGEI
jgi:cytolysin (calcineurin-like family phosphatase)